MTSLYAALPQRDDDSRECLKQVCGPLAQLVERLTLNQNVVGSIPTGSTKISITYGNFGLG